MADPPPPEAKSEQPPPAAATADPVEKPPAAADPPAAVLTPQEADAASAGDGSGEAEEYVSDPDDAPLSTMRRRDAASDDEGSEDGRPRARIGPDHDGDGQGAPEAYDDEANDAEEDEEYYDEEEEEEVGQGYEEEYEWRAPQAPKEDGGSGSGQAPRVVDGEEGMAEGQGEKKEQEPFAVPTSGAFYMHDDRFQEENRGRRRCVSSSKLDISI
jgi:hypothetical protein